MRTTRRILLALLAASLLGLGTTSASDLNEVGALLVYPSVVVSGAEETFMTVTNTGADAVTAHASFIDGDTCFECNFSFPLTGYDTETLVITTQTGFGVSIESLDGTVSRSCPTFRGMLVISLEDGNGNTITDNLLFGEAVYVAYAGGYAFSIPAIPFQGGVGNGDRVFDFNNVEYMGFPRRIAADFLASQFPSLQFGGMSAVLVLFTLDFESQFVPSSDCSVNGFDAHENNFSNSLLFGCWTLRHLNQIDPEFAYPNLGNPGLDEHGWLALDCQVNGKQGGVHGIIVQVATPNTSLRPNAPGPIVLGGAAWARVLYQSATAGAATQFEANLAPAGPGGFD